MFPRLAAELIRLKPDVLVVSITEAALADRNATSTIPIVMVSVPDPVASGLVASLGRPGGNVTGLSRQTRDLIGKNFQLLKEALPETTRVGVLTNPTHPLNSAMVADAHEAARSLGMQIRVVEASASTALVGAFSTMHADRFGAVLVLGGAAPSTRSSLKRPRTGRYAVELRPGGRHDPGRDPGAGTARQLR